MAIFKKTVRLLFIPAGFLSLGLGIVGIFLPVIPTTPLLLLASYCFMKGSERFEIWFKGTKIYKEHLEGFVQKREMTAKQKAVLLIFADSMIAIPFILTDSLFLRIFLAAVVVYKYYYFIARIKTIQPRKSHQG
ncbi:hypothetical protein A8F94_17925 [Bacillus sp. FJAT-27225]|uniref:YbaN family protein n=1 Tax=Bacillus sp. FJAT-27225 TaxID=1743144 RepID=UPI00080C33AA|nr:YbaN family protein [Bacillus sp. FJAT-27225]OCA83024.1 hypothetical protein A8F94_17925 [Bacillus sp. FJAT-27225]